MSWSPGPGPRRQQHAVSAAFASAVLAAFAALALAVAAPSAQAIGVAGVSAAPGDTTSGAHSDFNLKVDIADPGDDLKSLTVNLPTGQLGNPSATIRCNQDQRYADACPPDSAVGTQTAEATATILGGIGVPLTVEGTVYNVEPPPDEPARLGIVLRPLGGILGKIFLLGKVRVRDESDYGLETVVDNIPNNQGGIPIDLRSLSLTLKGQVAGGKTFMVNPTQCSTATTKVAITSYKSDKPATASASYRPTSCDTNPFQPGMEISIEQPLVDTPTAHSIGLTQPADINGRSTSHVKDATVNLPVGTSLNPSLAPTLELCSDAQFGKQGAEDVKCPARSKVGVVAFDNPLLGTVPGEVFFGRSPGDPYKLLIVGRKSGVTVKIKASVRPQDDTAQIITVFKDLPQVPFTKFNLTFFGGPRGSVVTPPKCGTYTGSMDVTPWSGTPTQSPTTSFGISDDGKGGCNPKLQPSIGGKVSTTRALDSPTFDLDLGRPADSRRPKELDVVLPSGLLGRINSVPMCQTAQAVRAACPANTRIATVATTVGSGPLPVVLRGTAYLGTGTSTSMARIWLDIPVKVGPIDLGTFVLANQLRLGQTDGRVHVNASLPDAFKGFPLALRRLQMKIDRKGFMLNPSGCDPRTFDLNITGVDGTQGSGQGAFQATECERLPFRPAMFTSVEDPKIRAAGAHPPLRTEIDKPDTDAALREVTLLASGGLTPNPAALSTICDPEQLAANSCPPAARLGTVTAVTPLLKDRLTGPVYLSFNGRRPDGDVPGLELPYLSAVLIAPGVRLRIDGELRLSPEEGRLEAKFTNLPDVPLSLFRLDIDGTRPDKVGSFTATDDLCAAAFLPSDVVMLGQNGKTYAGKPLLDAAACRQGALVRGDASGLGTARPIMAINIARNPRGSKPLRVASFRLPGASFGTRTARAGTGVVVKVDGRRLSRKHWSLSAKGTVTVRVPGKKGAQRINVGLSRGVIVPTDGLRAKARQKASGLSGADGIPIFLTIVTREVGGKRAITRTRFEGRP